MFGGGKLRGLVSAAPRGVKVAGGLGSAYAAAHALRQHHREAKVEKLQRQVQIAQLKRMKKGR